MTSEISTLTKVDDNRKTTHINKNTITYGTILTVVVSFMLGAITALLIVKMSGNNLESFTVTELVTFIFGIALSAASTVLAVVAISLGKASEQAMIDRSDNSIKLQNEVFVRTTDALQRIQSSTGVTEKRIEDIISGRAGNISEKIYESLLEKGGGKVVRDRETLERSVRQGLREGLKLDINENLSNATVEKIAKEEEANKRYDEFQRQVLVEIANLPNTKTEKLGDGSFSGSGDELVDTVFTINQERIGLSVLSNDSSLGMMSRFDGYLDRLALELTKGTFSRVFIAFTGSIEHDMKINNIISKFKTLLREEISHNILFFSGDLHEVINEITKAIENP